MSDMAREAEREDLRQEIRDWQWQKVHFSIFWMTMIFFSLNILKLW